MASKTNNHIKIYTSRYSNPELQKNIYAAVKISIGMPKWELGYSLSGEFPSLMPFGLLNRFERYEDFKLYYFRLLDRVGVYSIQKDLEHFKRFKKDVVLLCFEDIKKEPETWCHRTAFSEWWKLQTGDEIEELPDSTPVQLSLF